MALKSTMSAKSRLKTVLTEDRRINLYFVMARGVICALQATRGIDKVLVVTACDQIERLCLQLGVSVIRQARDAGTALAFDHAVQAIRQNGYTCPERLLMIAGDLPLVSTPALEAFIEESCDSPSVSIIADQRRLGTNALLCSPLDAIRPRFGIDSFRRHVDAALANGATMRVVESDSLSLDIDTPEDLDGLMALYRSVPGSISNNELRQWLFSGDSFRSKNSTELRKHAICV